MSDPVQQTTASKMATVCIGLCGVSMSLDKVAAILQPIGVIIGVVLVCGQAFMFFRGLYKGRKRKASNDG